MFRKIDKTSTFNDVLKQIIEKIQTGELQPGDALPAERILAEEFGISRPALREVLKALSLLGITVSVHGGANYIATDLRNCLTEPLSILFQMYNSKIQDALQLRGALESKAAFLAAQNCTPLDAAELQLIIARLDSTQDESIRGDLDRQSSDPQRSERLCSAHRKHDHRHPFSFYAEKRRFPGNRLPAYPSRSRYHRERRTTCRKNYE